MKLRIKDNSIRFRLLRTEVQKLAEEGKIESHTLLSATDPAGRLSYSIEHSSQYKVIAVKLGGLSICVTAPTENIVAWAKDDSATGLYVDQEVYGGETLHITLEKDFACIDRSDADNIDTFENPNAKHC
ncbi:DUF7009 family protein [Terriglobus roseus]|uniref:Uncharacterized protein n=1 Tax=Terriglobus roseus TaxID=392734 RepID=A0A1G7KIT5_9BACT|nr:hypothetical protein [Terriglobus roseus]SDF37001.1 hypothetical protein SAMN05444167_2198 [Terriglobus roseus]